MNGYPPGTPGATTVEVLARCTGCGQELDLAAERELGRLYLTGTDRCPDCGHDLEIEE